MVGLRIVVGSDDAGFEYKEALKKDLAADPRVDEIIDVGVHADGHTAYPHIGVEAGRLVADGKADRGLLVCGTGIGVAMAANKVRGVRAAACSEPYSAMLSKQHNNSIILTMGARVVGEEMAKMILDAWLTAEFQGGRHAERVAMITALEEKECGK